MKEKSNPAGDTECIHCKKLFESFGLLPLCLACTHAHLAGAQDLSRSKKEVFHKRWQKVLKAFAIHHLELKASDFDVTSNPAGPALTGEVYLHTESLYVCVSGEDHRDYFMFRSCKGRKDYTGGSNHHLPRELLETDPAKVLETFRKVMKA